MSETQNKAPMSAKEPSILQKLLFSDAMLGKSYARRVAYVGVTAGLCTVTSMFLEFKFLDVQFSLTIFMSVLAGILLGPLLGSAAVFLGDFIGYVYNSWGLLYYWWVALSCALMAVVAGLVMRLPFKFRGSGFVKLALICLVILAVCTVGVNTTGFYVYYTQVGFSQKSLDALSRWFGGSNTYLAYVLVRLFFLGQIWNSLANYVLLFVMLPVLGAIKPLHIPFA